MVVGLQCAATLDLQSVHEKEMRKQAERRKLARVRGHRLAGDPAAQRAAQFLMEAEWLYQGMNQAEWEAAGYPDDDASEERWAEWRRATRAAAKAYVAETGFDAKAVDIARDMGRRFDRTGELSDKQVRFLLKLRRQVEENKTRQAERQAERAEAADCPEGRVEIVGEVLKTEWRDNDWGGKLVQTVKSDEGFLVWGTVPSSVSVERGDRVRFTAQVSPSDDDPKFGFYKRPTKAEVI